MESVKIYDKAHEQNVTITNELSYNDDFRQKTVQRQHLQERSITPRNHVKKVKIKKKKVEFQNNYLQSQGLNQQINITPIDSSQASPQTRQNVES